MHDQPSVIELLQAVKNFINDTAAPNLTGHAAFHAKIASNVIDIIMRDISARPENDRREIQQLQALLEAEGQNDLAELNRILCERIRTGEITGANDDLMAHLKAAAISQIKVDQPRYSGLKTALGSDED
ncbi:MAG: DUF6285 domain-containing protein [Henriciella sp.]